MAEAEVDLPDRVPGSVVLQGLRILGRAVRARPRPFAASIVGALVYGGTTVLASIVLGRVTDRVVLPAFEAGRARPAALAAAAAAIVGVAVTKAAGIVLRRVGASRMQYQLHADHRRAIARRYLELPVEWHRARSTGSLLATANEDVEAVFSPIAPLPLSLGVLAMLLLAGGVMLATDPVLACVGFALAPAMSLLTAGYNRRYREPARRAQGLRGDVAGVAHESFDGALLVKVLGRRDAEVARFAAASERLRDELVRLGDVRARFDPLYEAVPQLAVLLVILVGAWRVRGGAVTAGEVVQFAYLFLQVALPIRVIGFFVAELPRSVAGWERVARVLDAQGAAAHGSDAVQGEAAVDVAVEGVAYRYPGAPARALVDVDLHAPRGRVVAVVGPTGAGKSTLVSLLARLADPDRGTIALDGVDLRRLARGELPATVAVAFQEAFTFDDTVRENVLLGLDADDGEVWHALRLAQLDGTIARLPAALDTRVGERGTTLSGGQRQRLALARALVRRPRVLVLDDATSAVDPAVEAAILDGLRAAELDATIVVVAARRATVALADEVVFVDDGRIAARGTHEELLSTSPGYRALLAAYARDHDAGGALDGGAPDGVLDDGADLDAPAEAPR